MINYLDFVKVMVLLKKFPPKFEVSLVTIFKIFFFLIPLHTLWLLLEMLATRLCKIRFQL